MPVSTAIFATNSFIDVLRSVTPAYEATPSSLIAGIAAKAKDIAYLIAAYPINLPRLFRSSDENRAL